MRGLLTSVAVLWMSLTGGCTAQPVQPDPAVFDGAFRPGFMARVPDQKERVGFRVVELGALKVTSGRIVAVDPFIHLDAPAFMVQVPPGAYPVRLAIADFGEDLRVALARIDILKNPVVRWEMALTPDQKLADLKSGEIFGYGVDAGTGSFADADAFAWLNQRYEGATAETYEALSNGWIKAGEAEGRARGLPYQFLLMAETGPRNNIAMFSSGWGDGVYATWVGYADDGRVAALVTDFAVVQSTLDP